MASPPPMSMPIAHDSEHNIVSLLPSKIHKIFVSTVDIKNKLIIHIYA
jgi:hypothetical protein